MKFLVHGNAPFAKTGYGIQIDQLTRQLKQDGHNPACSVTYGLQGATIDWHGIRLYGCGYDTHSNDRLHMHAAHWFHKEPGWIVTCMDVWGIKNPLTDFNVAAWVPIDHFTSTGPQATVMEFFEQTCKHAVPVAMSRFGEDMLRRAGLDPLYVPLSVDTNQYKPTSVLPNGMTGKQLMEVPEDAFVVTMVAMNKGWAKDRKGFSEAFNAFGMFEHEHKDAYLYVHADMPGGAEGQHLGSLATHAGIPVHKIKYAGGPNQYGYYMGYTPEMMAAVYTCSDVLLAPSHGEGFCVPIIESLACGTPVIASDFSSQRELVPEQVGWRVLGQPEWDPAHHGIYHMPYIADIVMQLEEAYKTDRAAMAADCVAFAANYDVDHVYENYWKPAIAELTAEPDPLELARPMMPAQDAVAVLCPIYKRTTNMKALAKSFVDTTGDEANFYFVVEHNDTAAFEAAHALCEEFGPKIGIIGTFGVSCAQKWNAGYQATSEPWVLCIGDDVRFHEGWLTAARRFSQNYDVIGTNDTAGAAKNPKVANGSHADHFFVRRTYIDDYGAALDGPGVLAPEAYRHWYVDMEIVRLARARGVFTPCLESIVEHLHPGYDGDEEARQADPTYMTAVEYGEPDKQKFMERLPLIEQHRTGRMVR